jgi:dTMP kinase
MPASGAYPRNGVFVALEGGEGAGKSTQARLLESWLTGQGYDVVLTHEPGGSDVGQKLREILLDPRTGALDHRAEALLYAADKAEHLDKIVDSTLAYQGAGRDLDTSEVERIARWATTDLRPHLTVLLDVEPGLGLRRVGSSDQVGSLDRLESEPVTFHERVRRAFLALAAADPDHYLVVDGGLDREALAMLVRERVQPCLGLATRQVGARR